jgi:hypothetical protein
MRHLKQTVSNSVIVPAAVSSFIVPEGTIARVFHNKSFLHARPSDSLKITQKLRPSVTRSGSVNPFRNTPRRKHQDRFETETLGTHLFHWVSR